MPPRELRAFAWTWVFLVATPEAGFPAGTRATADEPRHPAAAVPADAAPAPGRMFVVGRVLDPKGQPVPGAAIMLYARDLHAGAPYRLEQVLVAEGRADGSGRFRIEAPRMSSLRFLDCGAAALAPGFGVGWVVLDPDDDQPIVDIALRPEQVIQGRLFDLQGRPVPDVAVAVSSVYREPLPVQAGRRSRFDGVSRGPRIAGDVPAWPLSAKTDAEGRFTVRGVGRDVTAALAFLHPRFALTSTEVHTDGAPGPTTTAALAPSQIVNVRVTYADTGKPVPHAPLRVMSNQVRFRKLDEAETDDVGRARVNSWATQSGFGITAYPPEGQPYLSADGKVAWPKGALEQSLDIALPRGVLIRGKVTEEGTGKPVPGATVGFTLRGNDRQNLLSGAIQVSSADDGSFRLGARPGPGYLFIMGPSDEYVLEEIGYDRIHKDQPGGPRVRAHAHIGLDLRPGSDPEEIHVALRRGVSVTGRVIGPDGQPVREAWIIGRTVLGPGSGAWRSWSGQHGQSHQGRFELHGLDPHAETPVHFLDPGRKLGATVDLSGKSIALMTMANRTGRPAVGETITFSDRSGVRGPIDVRLEPCGAARARFVDPDGKPVAGRLPGDLAITMVVTPGPPRSSAPQKADLLFAEGAEVNRVDTVNYPAQMATDAEGRLTLPVLIPGATYRIVDYTAGREAAPQVRKEFTVKPGETIDLGEIRVEKRPR